MTAQSLPSTLKSAWPLLFGVVMLMIGNGLQGTLLSLRATMEGFDITITGIVMSFYFVGYVLGSILTPKMVARVGHIRVFAALASIASVTVLLHFVFVNPVVWAATRAATGFAYAGLYVVIESWLNGMASNKTRGKILSVYMFLVYFGMMAGQLLLNIADPRGVELFVTVSALVTLALLPICLSRTPAPPFGEAPRRLSLRALYRTSPLGVVGAMTAGLLSSAMMTIAPVYGTALGMSVAQVSVFMGVMIFGSAVMQYPAGWLSDRIDRRKVMLFCCGGAGLMAVACGLTVSGEAGFLFYACAFLFWGLGTPIYALATSHTNDHLQRDQIVAASSALILMNGIGSVAGPALLSNVMKALGSGVFFAAFAVAYAAITAFILHRIRLRAPVADEEKGRFVNISDANTPVSAQLVEGSQPG